MEYLIFISDLEEGGKFSEKSLKIAACTRRQVYVIWKVEPGASGDQYLRIEPNSPLTLCQAPGVSTNGSRQMQYFNPASRHESRIPSSFDMSRHLITR